MQEEIAREFHTQSVWYHHLFRSLPLNLMVLTPDAIILDFTDCLGSITMKSRSELIGFNLFEAYEITEESQREEIWASQEFVRLHHLSHNMPLLRFDLEISEEKGGGYEAHYWQTSHHPVLDENGDLLYILMQTEDKTSQRKAELRSKFAQRALQETQDRDQFILNSLPILIWTVKPNGKADYLNETWLNYTGKTESELLGWRWVHVVHPDDRETILELWREAMEKGEKFQTEYRLMAENGQFRWFQTSGVPRFDANNEILMWVVSSTDIHEYKKRELLAQGAFLYQKSQAVPLISPNTLREPSHTD
jgi:PAS domain S-box-containing protein